jgi:endonuclease/exonuclease/phosphatase family metal-dependent hydrolase
LLIAIVSFYFWGRASNFTEAQYIAFSNRPPNNLGNRDTLALMTYNIGYMSGMTNNLAVERPKSLIQNNLGKTYKLIQELNPDIIGFQEIDFSSNRTNFVNQLDSIYEKLSFSSQAMAVNWDKKYVPFPYWPIKHHFGSMYSGQAVLSNYKILRNNRIVLPQPKSNPIYYNDFYLDRLAQITWLELKETALLLINVHLEAWDGSTREKQIDIVLDFYRKYASKYPVVIMGDFNCTPPFSSNAFTEKTIVKLMNEPGLSMCTDQQDFNSNESEYYTFSSDEPFQKIDYIFYNTRFFNCIESRVVQEAGEISDHLPIFAKLTFKTEKVVY